MGMGMEVAGFWEGFFFGVQEQGMGISRVQKQRTEPPSQPLTSAAGGVRPCASSAHRQPRGPQTFLTTSPRNCQTC